MIELICLGDELLDGTIADKNVHFLGDFLASRGRSLDAAHVAPDDRDAIIEMLSHVRGDVVIVSGGLGPTADDITRDAAAAWQNVALTCDADVLERLRARFEARGRTFTKNNARQAFFPEGATVLPSEVGTASGFRIDLGSRAIFFFPGVPSEFRWFCQNYVADALASTPRTIRRLHFHGIGESQLETHLDGIEELGKREGVKIGYRAEYPIIEVKFSGEAEACDILEAFTRTRLAAFFVGDAFAPLPARIGELLKARNETVATAESCTAGMIAAALTDVAGSSAYFGYGYVSYANDAKFDMLGVSPRVLDHFGAVSPQVATQMALGALRASQADWAIAVSGIAGPGGGTPDKPVGTVDFAVSGPPGTFHRRVHFPVRTRALIRKGTVYSALSMLGWLIDDAAEPGELNGPFSEDEVMADLGITLESSP